MAPGPGSRPDRGGNDLRGHDSIEGHSSSLAVGGTGLVTAHAETCTMAATSVAHSETPHSQREIVAMRELEC